MEILRTLTGLCSRLIRSRAAIFLGMAAVAYALASSTTTRAAPTVSGCAAGGAGYDAYYSSIPFGQILNASLGCSSCHSTSPNLNSFGTDYEASPHLDYATFYVHQWTIDLAARDSDGDGYTNGEELQDPQGNWISGDMNPPSGGDSNLVTDPGSSTSLPSAPTISQILGVTSGGTIQGAVTLQVQLSTTYGARSVIYEIIDGGNSTVVSFTRQTGATPYGGYTPLVSTFNQSWDTNDVPNGTYTVRATLTDGTGLVARKSVVSVTSVTVDNPARSLRYVAPGGVDSGGCLSSAAPCASPGYAVAQAANNDEIRIAAGTYAVGSGAAPLAVGVRVSLRGGYATGSWAAPDPQAHVTTFDGQGQRPVLAFTAAADGFSVSGITIANGAGSLGAGVSVSGATGSFSDVIFRANQSSGDGGGLAVDASGGATLERASFLGNTAAGRGGAIFSQGPLTLTNVLFGRNSAAQGGALALGDAGVSTITYATLAGDARPEEAILLAGASDQLALTNTLISGYAVGARLGASGPSLTLQQVLATSEVGTPVAVQGGSVSGTPLSGPVGYQAAADDDYRLAFGSPAINAGAATPAVVGDRDGNPRPTDGATDIGAYEFQGPAGVLLFSIISPNVQQPAAVATMEARLSVASVRPVSVHYATTDGSATNGVDYTATSGDLLYAPGETSKMIAIPVLNPSPAATLPRSFAITLSAPSGAKLSTFSTAIITLLPPPEPPRVTLSATVAVASRYGPRDAIIIFERDVATDTPMTVSYNVGGDAQPGVDYAPLPGTITFPAGALSATLRISPTGGDGPRMLTITLEPDAAYLLGRTRVAVRFTGSLAWLIYLPTISDSNSPPIFIPH
ncbi:hypothetical protein EKD04_024285 [Chloroflexales bacterium ZM16-3]|nr:hypothetical protein [Chloroflexales bacterium ZM16-3]